MKVTHPIRISGINLYFLLLMLIPNILYSQQTKKVVDKEKNETYYVLKNDNAIRHGEYRLIGNRGNLLVKGYYKMGQKDSIWKCYNFSNKLNLKYDYSKKELLYYKSEEDFTEPFEFNKDETNKEPLLNSRPIYLGGIGCIGYFISKNITYPIKAKENSIDGKVFVHFTVDKWGKASNHHVKDKLGYGLDEESIRVIKLLPDDWLPALKEGVPVESETFIVITYQLR